MTVIENGYAHPAPTIDGGPGPLRITTPDQDRALFLERAGGGDSTSWLWLRHERGHLAGVGVGLALTAADWRRIAEEATAIARDLDRNGPTP